MRPITRPLLAHLAGELPVTQCCRRMSVSWVDTKKKSWGQPDREYNYLMGDAVGRGYGPADLIVSCSAAQLVVPRARQRLFDIIDFMKYVPSEGFLATN